MLYFTVFISGAVLMALEMVGSRILAPTYGSSIYVWGSLIVVVMTALTTGYFFGGKLSDRKPDFIPLGIILTIAGIFIGFLPFWTQPVNHFFWDFEPRLGSLLSSLIFFFLPGVLLAAVSPFGVKLAGQNLKTIGKTAGQLSALSSGGSIAGTLVTSFFLIPVIGVRSIVHILGLILFLTAAAIFIMARGKIPAGESKKEKTANKEAKTMLSVWIGFLFFISLTLIILWKTISLQIYPHDPKTTKILFDKDTFYHHIIVDQVGRQRHLHFDESYQSAVDLDNPTNMIFDYTSYIHLGAVSTHPKNALFVGMGGGLVSMKFFYDYPGLTNIENVEIDPDVISAAEKYFLFPNDLKIKNHAQDGRIFVDKKAAGIKSGKSQPYDIVVLDTYYATTIPFHLTTMEFLNSVKGILHNRSTVVCNIIGTVDGDYSRLLKSMTVTFRKVFPQVYLFPVGGWVGPENDFQNNFILIATMNPEKWDKYQWEDRAKELYRNGAIKADVPDFANHLLDESKIKNGKWLDGSPLLTDDFAPVDTLRASL